MAKTHDLSLTPEERAAKLKQSKAEVEEFAEILNAAGNVSRKITFMDAPPYFNEKQLSRFDQLIPLFLDLPVNLNDLQSVERYCVLCCEFAEATIIINDIGLITNEGRKNPAIAIRNEAAKEMRLLEQQLGLSAHSRIKLKGGEKEKDNDDPFEKMYTENESN